MVKRHCITAFAITILLTAPAFAADPHDGLWNYDGTRSYWTNGKLDKNMRATIEVTFGDNTVHYHSVNYTEFAQPYVTDFNVALDGTPGPLEHSTRFNQVAIRQLGPDSLQVLKMKDGDVIVGEFWTFLPDGKTMVRHGVAKPGPGGPSKAYQETFVRN